jgi:hypothetical protein
MKGFEGHGISRWATCLAWTALALGAVPALLGCNELTRIGDLKVDKGIGGSGGAGSGNGAGGSAVSSSSTGPTLCPYPMGGWTQAVGGTLPQSMNWQGMVENSNTQTTIKIEDYLDCDGTHGIHAILIDTSATWCGACITEAQELPSLMTTWGPMGIKVLTLMIEGQTNGVKATYQDAVDWTTQFGLDAIAVGVDPGFSFAPAGQMTVGLPVQTIVDPRTMQVVEITEGYSGNHTTLLNLAHKNKGP